MIIRTYESADLAILAELFCETIRHVNSKDYTKEQVDAWSSRSRQLLGRDEFFRRLYTLVAEIEQDGRRRIAGYGNIDDTGYLDHLFVHKDFQGQHIASRLCDGLEAYAWRKGIGEITVHASITARPFFLKRGYVTKQEQLVDVDGVMLKNYVMKYLSSPGK